jgi:hypothetical protein
MNRDFREPAMHGRLRQHDLPRAEYRSAGRTGHAVDARFLQCP